MEFIFFDNTTTKTKLQPTTKTSNLPLFAKNMNNTDQKQNDIALAYYKECLLIAEKHKLDCTDLRERIDRRRRQLLCADVDNISDGDMVLHIKNIRSQITSVKELDILIETDLKEIAAYKTVVAKKQLRFSKEMFSLAISQNDLPLLATIVKQAKQKNKLYQLLPQEHEASYLEPLYACFQIRRFPVSKARSSFFFIKFPVIRFLLLNVYCSPAVGGVGSKHFDLRNPHLRTFLENVSFVSRHGKVPPEHVEALVFVLENVHPVDDPAEATSPLLKDVFESWGCLFPLVAMLIDTHPFEHDSKPTRVLRNFVISELGKKRTNSQMRFQLFPRLRNSASSAFAWGNCSKGMVNEAFACAVLDAGKRESRRHQKAFDWFITRNRWHKAELHFFVLPYHMFSKILVFFFELLSTRLWMKQENCRMIRFYVLRMAFASEIAGQFMTNGLEEGGDYEVFEENVVKDILAPILISE